MKDIKDRIKEIRKENNKTQLSFAESLNVSKSTIEAIEYGRRIPTDRIISDICRMYEINNEWLTKGEGSKNRDLGSNEQIAKITNQMLDEVEPSIRKALYNVVYNLTEEELEVFLNFARKLVAEYDNESENPPE